MLHPIIPLTWKDNKEGTYISGIDVQVMSEKGG